MAPLRIGMNSIRISLMAFLERKNEAVGLSIGWFVYRDRKKTGSVGDYSNLFPNEERRKAVHDILLNAYSNSQ